MDPSTIQYLQYNELRTAKKLFDVVNDLGDMLFGRSIYIS